MITKIKSNLKSGCTIALISIPLSISLAVASRVSPVQGIITALWAGLVASFFAGSNFNIIGPTGALSGIIASYVLTHGIEVVSMLAIMAGIIILIAYLLRFERYLIFIPSSVIHGFTLGIASIIALNQINFACGLKNLSTHEEFIKNVWESITHIHQGSLVAFSVFFTFFIALLITSKYLPMLPGVIIFSPLGIILGYTSADWLQLETLGSKFGTIQVTFFQTPSLVFSQQLIWCALTIALIAILETMLSAKIADNLTKTKHKMRQEIFGLGMANIASGLAGGIPATAALARTVLNVKSGATNKISATISSIFIGIISSIFLFYFTFMPMAVIAAILVNVAINMVEAEHFSRLFTHDKINFGVSMFVACLTVYKDPIIGILVGASISLLLFVEQLSRGYYDVSIQYSKDLKHEHGSSLQKLSQDDDVLIYTFKGKLSYINSHAHIVRFETDLQSYQTIILCLREVYFIDIDGIDALDEIIEIAQKQNKKILIASTSPFVKNLIKTVSRQFYILEKKGLIFETTSDALHYLQKQHNN